MEPKAQVPATIISSSNLWRAGRGFCNILAASLIAACCCTVKLDATLFFPLESGMLWISPSVNPSFGS